VDTYVGRAHSNASRVIGNEPPRLRWGLHRVSEDGALTGSSRRPREVRERAVALVFEQLGQYSSRWEATKSISAKVGVSAESLRRWVHQAETDAGALPGVTTTESQRLW